MQAHLLSVFLLGTDGLRANSPSASAVSVCLEGGGSRGNLVQSCRIFMGMMGDLFHAILLYHY